MSNLPLRFSFQFTGKVWQTALDAHAGKLAVEVRDQATYQLGFELLDLESGQRQHVHSFGVADWWTTLLRLEGSLLLAEKYNDPNDPTDKELVIYDVAVNKIVDVLPFFQLISITENELIGHHSRETEKPMRHALKQVHNSSQATPRVLFPAYFAPGSEDFHLLRDYLRAPAAELGCEYLEVDDYIIASYYQQSGTKFDRMLLVIKGDDEICRQAQDQSLEGFASGSFFVYDQLLIFTQNSHQINGMEL